MPKVNWVEIPAEDLDRARMFYSQLFGWKIEEPHWPEEGIISL